MDDVKREAEKRAKKKDAPIGSAFETEHQRQKNALMNQIGALDGRNIQKIEAHSEQKTDKSKKMRVVAYCRVSTDDIDQAISIKLQIDAYKKKITSNPDWEYMGTYVDDGFSGTNTTHRPGFQKLMKDALNGRFDMIITKSVSRLARNLLDCIGCIEELKAHDPPVRVFFEQENLDTGLQSSGIILFVLAMVAEEESHMKSEAMLLSLEWRFSRGRFMTPRLFGYDKVEVPDSFGGTKKVLQINEREARVVKWMYATLLNGSSTEEIAEILTELAVPTGWRKRNGELNYEWTRSGVTSIMRNEKHCGDVLARKTYTPNFKDHKAKKNNGKKNKYFQPDHHEPIVTRTIWNAAQRILNSRKYHHEGTYLPMRIIESGVLTGFISMNRSWAGFEADDYCKAAQKVMGLTDDVIPDIENEFLPDGGHRIGGLMDDHGITQIARELSEAEQKIKDELEGKDSEEQMRRNNEEIVKTFQVVNGDMFSRIHEPVVRISKKCISFNSSCVSKMKAEYAEILFNPVERILIARPCEEDDPNAIKWDKKPIGASSLCKVFYDALGWESDYTYRMPCQVISAGDSELLLFDLDNYIGRAVNKKEEVIIARRQEEAEADFNEDSKSFYYPPEASGDNDGQELTEQVEQAIEINKKIFGTPVYDNNSEFRGIDERAAPEEWFMPAKPLDSIHSIDESTVDGLLSEIMDDPPEHNENNGNTDIIDTEQR